jgi:hypothetical protein
MSAGQLRIWLIATLAAAAVVSVVAQKSNSSWLGWLSFAIFLGGVALYFSWRRAVKARVSDRETKTTE